MLSQLALLWSPFLLVKTLQSQRKRQQQLPIQSRQLSQGNLSRRPPLRPRHQLEGTILPSLVLSIPAMVRILPVYLDIMAYIHLFRGFCRQLRSLWTRIRLLTK